MLDIRNVVENDGLFSVSNLCNDFEDRIQTTFLDLTQCVLQLHSGTVIAFMDRSVGSLILTHDSCMPSQIVSSQS